jgi:hypothetical protein
MKWTFIIQQKIKVIVLLTSMIALIGVTNYLEHQNIDQIDESFNSIYYDRLIPATELLHMTQNLYKQRMLMESALLSTQPVPQHLDKALDDLTRNTEERIINFEKTFMVKHESYALVSFKRGMHEYETIEEEVVNALHAGHTGKAREIYYERLRPKFSQTLSKLEDLSSIQTSVGKDILEQSRSTISNSSLILTLQIVTAIIIGVMTHALIIASRMVNVNANNFHLN